MSKELETLLTDEEAMVYLKIKDKRTLRSYLRKGLGYTRIGRSRQFTPSQLRDFVNSHSTCNI